MNLGIRVTCFKLRKLIIYKHGGRMRACNKSFGQSSGRGDAFLETPMSARDQTRKETDKPLGQI